TGGINTSNVTGFTYSSRFARLGVRYRAVSGATQLTITPSAGIDDVDARASQDGLDKGLHRTTVPLSLRADVATPHAGAPPLVGLLVQHAEHAAAQPERPDADPRAAARSIAVGRRPRRVRRAIVVPRRRPHRAAARPARRSLRAIRSVDAGSAARRARAAAVRHHADPAGRHV